LFLPLRGDCFTLEILRGDAGSRRQGGVQGLLDQSRCARHRDILLVINLWGLWLGLRDDWSGLGNRLGLRNSDWRWWWAVTGSHLY
jgi:hypothetical protein